MIHVVHWKQDKAEGIVEQDCWPTRAVACKETKRILADGYGLTKAKITDVGGYGGQRHNKAGTQTA